VWLKCGDEETASVLRKHVFLHNIVYVIPRTVWLKCGDEETASVLRKHAFLHNIVCVIPRTVWLKCGDEETASVLRKHAFLIETSSSSSAVHIVTTATVPDGCSTQTISAKCQAYLMLKVG
jgi:hypothetical protein